MTGCLQQCTEMPQLQQTRYEEPSHDDQGELAPINHSQLLLSSLCGYHSLTPITVTQNNDISLSEFHKPSHHPSLIQWRGLTSDVSRTATPMSLQSSYSNSSGYANAAQSSQSNAPVPAAPFSSPSLHVPDGISQYERNRQKNRAATARCREKTQQYTQELREQERDLLSKKQSLKACIADLQDEVLALKTEILQHSHCDCDHIQRYLRAAASQVA